MRSALAGVRAGRARTQLDRARARTMVELADRYRHAVETRSGELPVFLAAAAVWDNANRGAAAARRTARRVGRGRPGAAGTAPESPAVRVSAARVGAGRDIAVCLQGPAELLDRVAGLAVAGGTGLRPLDTLLRRDVDVLRLNALPDPGPGGPVVVLDAAGAQLPYGTVATVPDAPAAESSGPAANRLDRVDVALFDVSVRWTPPPGAPAELRLTGDGAPIVVPARRVGGGARCVVAVADLPAGRFTVCCAGQDGSDLPLVRPLDRYPALDRAPAPVPARDQAGGAAHVRYDAKNRLQLLVCRPKAGS